MGMRPLQSSPGAHYSPRSRPTKESPVPLPRPSNAFAGALTRGSIGTILATIKIENTQRYREDLWLGDLDSNQD